MFTSSVLALSLTLGINFALAAPVSNEKRQNNPLFGGWDNNENVTELITELYAQANPIDREVLMPSDGLNFDFLSEYLTCHNEDSS